ncbi:DUF6491 family protein [Brevundimonas sp.]|uniref:DUF6491 family protein n=1 Tax=Brevundimonas sp. TaxID=1871086 RepID=UPI002E15CF8B|nr:DUF6491 family protein [Brevundimonas sp.]
MIRSLPLAAALALLAAGCAPTPGGDGATQTASRPERACFSVDQVRNFRQGGVGQVYVRAAGGDVFQLDSAGGCQDLGFAQRLAILPDGAGLAGGRVCTSDAVRIAVPGSTTSTDVCRARVTRRLTEAEVAALPSRERP